MVGVAIATFTGENGLLNRAKTASDETKKQEALEELKLKVLEVQTDKQGNATLEDFIEYLKNDTNAEYIISLEKTSSINGEIPDITGKDDIYITYKGYEFKVTKKLNIEYVGGSGYGTSSSTDASKGDSSSTEESEENSANTKIEYIDFYKGKLQSPYSDGDGTEDNPYIIETPAQFKFFALSVSEGKNNYKDKYIKLEDDIPLDSTKQWTPIGFSTTGNISFQGTFDGNGKTVSGIYIDNEASNQGLFYMNGERGTIKNLTIEGSISAGSTSGGICAINKGNIIRCKNNATISQKNTNNDSMGGIVGNNSGVISECCNTGTISGIFALGGICGFNDNEGVIKKCYNKGEVSASRNVAGGITGITGYRGKAYVINCYNIIQITGGVQLGGISGRIGSTDNGGTGYIYNCYSINNTNNIAGVSENSSVSTTGYTTITNTETDINKLNQGIDEFGKTESTESPWEADSTTNPINGGYPILSWQK